MPAKRPTRPADAPVRWLVYCRQSDSDEVGERSLSLESQERVLRDAATAQGATVVAAVRDADLKGYQDETQRPALAEALAAAKRGDYDVLAVWEISRFARKLSLQERVLELLEGYGVRLFSHQEPWTGDPLVRQILGAVNEQQTRTISAHVRRAVRERIRTGQWHGPVPYGYLLDSDHRLIPDPELVPWVVGIHERFRDGLGIMEILRWLLAMDAPDYGSAGPRRADVARWNWRRVHRILTNPVYAGTRVVDGALVPDSHPAIVPPRLHAAVQERNARETSPGTRRARKGREVASDSFLRGGRLRCQCGRVMGANARRHYQRERFLCRGERSGQGYETCGYYPRSIGMETAEAVVRQRLVTDLESLGLWRQLAPIIRRDIVADQPDRARDRREALRARTSLIARQGRARELFVAGRIELEDFDALNAPLVAQLADLDAKVSALPDDDQVMADLKAMVAQAPQLATLLETASQADIVAWMEQSGAVAHLDPAQPDMIRVDYGATMTTVLAASRGSM